MSLFDVRELHLPRTGPTTAFSPDSLLDRRISLLQGHKTFDIDHKMTSEQQPHGEVLLSAINLSRAVNNKQHVLWRGISFDVCRGDIMFVRGPSGVGKTLLLRTLACLDPVEVSRTEQLQQQTTPLCSSCLPG
jgi:ABC-type uncharacterized transport system fused permease/ATPase subunit